MPFFFRIWSVFGAPSILATIALAECTSARQIAADHAPPAWVARALTFAGGAPMFVWSFEEGSPR